MFNYGQIREGLFSLVDALNETVRSETLKSLAALRSKIEEETFNLVVIGQFKRGKSTFINALLGENILPTAIIPLTSVVTILRYGPQLVVEVQYLDERNHEIDLSELPGYITERGNPQNKKGVKDVTIFYPSPYLKGGVRIIDTPGTGSVYKHNTDVAYNFLPFVDAAVFVLSADPPLSGSEHQFLKDVRAYVDKLFFVLNKIDQVSEEDRQESLDFTCRVIEDDIGVGRVSIYPLCAKWAIEGKKSSDGGLVERSLLPEFELRLQEFLVKEKGRVFLASVINSLLKLLADETISFELEQEAIKLPVGLLKEKIARFEHEMKVIVRDRENNQFLLKGHLNKIVSGLDEEISAFKREKLPVLHRELEAEYRRRVERGGGGLRGDLEQFVFGRIQETFNEWRQSLTEIISSRLEDAHRDFATKINETIERILALTSDIFELKLRPFTAVETLSRRSEFYFLLKDDPVGLELIQLAATSALPQFIAKKMILKNMRSAMTDLLDRHCGRVRYDLVNRLNKTVRDFQKDLNEKIDLTLEGIRISFQKALALHNAGKRDVDRNLDELSAKLGSISELRDRLIGLCAEMNQV